MLLQAGDHTSFAGGRQAYRTDCRRGFKPWWTNVVGTGSWDARQGYRVRRSTESARGRKSDYPAVSCESGAHWAW